MSRRRFVLLDRDGTIVVEKHYLSDPAELELIEGAANALRRLSGLDLGLVVVTNQSGVGRGFFEVERVEAIHRRLQQQLAAEGVRLDAILYCPHHPEDGCSCRKPATGMVDRAAARLGFEPAESFVVGDLPSDIDLGRALGATTLLVRTGHGAETERDGGVRPDHVVDDLAAAAHRIEELLGGRLESRPTRSEP